MAGSTKKTVRTLPPINWNLIEAERKILKYQCEDKVSNFSEADFKTIAGKPEGKSLMRLYNRSMDYYYKHYATTEELLESLMVDTVDLSYMFDSLYATSNMENAVTKVIVNAFKFGASNRILNTIRITKLTGGPFRDKGLFRYEFVSAHKLTQEQSLILRKFIVHEFRRLKVQFNLDDIEINYLKDESVPPNKHVHEIIFGLYSCIPRVS